MPPAGYVGYVAVAEDGLVVARFEMLAMLETPERLQRCVDGLYTAIDEVEAMRHATSLPPLPIPDSPTIRLLP